MIQSNNPRRPRKTEFHSKSLLHPLLPTLHHCSVRDRELLLTELPGLPPLPPHPHLLHLRTHSCRSLRPGMRPLSRQNCPNQLHPASCIHSRRIVPSLVHHFHVPTLFRPPRSSPHRSHGTCPHRLRLQYQNRLHRLRGRSLRGCHSSLRRLHLRNLLPGSAAQTHHQCYLSPGLLHISDLRHSTHSRKTTSQTHH